MKARASDWVQGSSENVHLLPFKDLTSSEGGRLKERHCRGCDRSLMET